MWITLLLLFDPGSVGRELFARRTVGFEEYTLNFASQVLFVSFLSFSL